MSNNSIDTKIDEKKQEEMLKEIEEMGRVGLHFGYSRSSRHPKAAPYIFALRNNVEIFNLEKTYFCLERAREFLRKLGAEEKTILFVGTKPEIRDIVEKIARELNMPYVVERWLGGTLTNFGIVKKQIENFEELCRKKTEGEFEQYSKKEASRLNKRLLKLEKYFGGLRGLKSLPEALMIIDPRKEKTAVIEARKVGIPVISLFNTDCDPTFIDYPLPGNDSSLSSVKYILEKIAKAYKEGRDLKKKIG